MNKANIVKTVIISGSEFAQEANIITLDSEPSLSQIKELLINDSYIIEF